MEEAENIFDNTFDRIFCQKFNFSSASSALLRKTRSDIDVVVAWESQFGKSGKYSHSGKYFHFGKYSQSGKYSQFVE